MKLLVIVVYDSDRLADILTVLVELEIRNAVAVDSEGLMHVLAQEVPIFAGLRRLITTPKSPCKTVFGVTDDKDIITKLDRALKAIDIDMAQPETGYALLIPVEALLESSEQ